MMMALRLLVLALVLSFVIYYLTAIFRRAKQNDQPQGTGSATRTNAGHAEKLAEKGYELLREDDPDGALRVAAELEKTRYSASFEIAALAHAAKGELERAVKELQRGVEAAPTVYLLWQLLGNYLSDLGRYDEAETAYAKALACPRSWPGSVKMNLAILESRRGQLQKTLDYLVEVSDPVLEPKAEAIRIDALRRMGRLKEALTRAEAMVDRGPAAASRPELAGIGRPREPDEEGLALWGRVAADLGHIRLELGALPDGVRSFAFRCLAQAPACRELLGLLREIQPRRSPKTRLFKINLHGTIPLKSPLRPVEGFYVMYLVAAETKEQALSLAEEVESAIEPAELRVDAAVDDSPLPDEAIGVLQRSGRIYYGGKD